MDAREAVAAWGLAPHPEGGFYKETFRSALTAAPPGWPGERSLATAILYLLGAGERSARHRVRGEELWLWQGGAPMALRVGEEEIVIGPDHRSGQRLQALVPAGEWQSATPVEDFGEEGWSLVACVVAPGFDFADFELA